MKGRPALAWLLCVGAIALAGAARAQSPAPEREDPEEPAMSTSGVAGEIMDLAVEECRRGDGAQALALFRAIRAQLDPPPAILRLIQDLEATGCAQRPLATTTGLRVQLAGGYDTNVTQGIGARTLVIGTGANAIELPLDQTYLPRSSSFTQASVDYGLVLPGSGIGLQATAAHRHNTDVASFDLSSASLGGSREFKFGDRLVRAQADVAEIWLGAQHYQSTRGAGLQWIWTSQAGNWLASANIVRIDYLTQPAQNALVRDAGLLFERRLDAATSVSGGGSLLFDKATNGRPGGDRSGFQLQVSALLARFGWRWRPQVSYARWTSADVFAPGLIDVRRRNVYWQAVLQAEKPLSPRSSVVFEWRGRWAQDSVVLYAYKAQTFTTTYVRRF